MSGFVAVLRFDGGPPDAALFAALIGRIRDRGPDGEGSWSGGEFNDGTPTSGNAPGHNHAAQQRRAPADTTFVNNLRHARRLQCSRRKPAGAAEAR